MLWKLSDDMLVEGLHHLVRTERKITQQIIESIAEVDRRELHLVRGYPKINHYLVKVFGYSETAASRRVDAVRLFPQIPAVAEQIVSGAINLSQASLLTQTIRAADLSTGQPVTSEQKRDILEKIENCTYQESQQIIHRELGVLPPVSEKSKIFGDGSVTLTITLTAEQAARWKQAGELASHAIGSQTSAELMDYLATKEIAERTEIKRASPIRSSPSQNPRAIAPNVRKYLLNSSSSELPKPKAPDFKNLKDVTPPPQVLEGCCYVDAITGNRCGSRRFLQIDHRQSVWAGGGRGVENLQLLCSAHNRWKYRKECGIKKIPNRKNL